MQPVILPVLGANMSHGIVRKWLKREGDPVAIGEPLFEVETDKINAEVEADSAGVLRQIVAPVGTRVAVLDVVAFVGALDEPIPDFQPTAPVVSAQPQPDLAASEPVTAAPIPPAAAGGRVAASPAAKRLARELGVALEKIHGRGTNGEITRADVEAAAQAAPTGSGAAGRLDEAFLNLLKRDAAAFRSLSSEMKIDLYRKHGAKIGDHVRIETGAIILAGEIFIGTAASIGADSTIDCERFALGRLSALGRRTRVHCKTVQIGDALWAKDDVTIGGGGSNEAGAHFKAGDACFIGEAAYINPCHPVTFGDEVCIGVRAMLFTHSHWQSVLQGYSSTFAPVHVGDHVFIGNSAFLFPGVNVGSGATVTVNSFVALNVAPRTMVSGVPAQVIRHITAPPREEQVRLIRERLPELASALGERGFQVKMSETDDVVTFDIDKNAAIHFIPSWPAVMKTPARPRTVVLTFADGSDPAVGPQTTLFDLSDSRVHGMQDRLSDEVREFCRRRGIRFRPFAWRYGVGHFDGDRFVRREK